MAKTISVTPAKLNATASAFDGTNNEIKNLTSQMTQIVTGLSGKIWTGDASRVYINRFNGLQDDVNKIHRMINEHVTDLQEMAREYERAERSNISEAHALKSDVIV